MANFRKQSLTPNYQLDILNGGVRSYFTINIFPNK